MSVIPISSTTQNQIQSSITPSPLAEQEGATEDYLDQLEEDVSDSRKQSDSATFAALFKLLPLGLSIFTLLYLFYLGGQISSIRSERNQVLVQTVNGRSIVAEPVDNYVRTAATIEKTVKLWTDLTFNWVQKLPTGEKDPGKKIGSKVFPTRLIQGNTLLSGEIQKLWYQVFQEREDYLPRNFLTSNATRIFFPSLQTTPKPPVDPRTGQPIENRYEVEVFGDWVEYSSAAPQGKLVDRIALKLRLRPVVKTESPLSKDADSLQKAAYELRANGLEIYDIQRIPYVR